jgi:hypothetical protein
MLGYDKLILREISPETLLAASSMRWPQPVRRSRVMIAGQIDRR